MKKAVGTGIAILLVLVMVLSFASCGGYGTIEKRFLDAGYEVVDTTDEDGNNYLNFATDLGEEGDVSCTVHILKAGKILSGTLRYAVIVEFGSETDAREALSKYMEEEDMKALFESIQGADVINGSCLLIPVVVGLDDSLLEEMVTLFKG